MPEPSANALTALRVACTPLLVACVLAEPSWFTRLSAPILFAVAASTDYLDGRVARRRGTDSAAGRWFDHLADIGFILTVLGSYVAVGVVPWWVPVSIAGAFAFYVSDSLRGSAPDDPPRLIASRLGHLGGVFNYVLIGILVGNETLGLRWLPEIVLRACFVAVPVYSLAGAAARRRAGARGAG